MPHTLDPQDYARRRFAEMTAEFAWSPHSIALMRAAQRRGRRRLDAVLGGLSLWERVPLKADILETRDFGEYRRETLRFATRPDLDAFGYFLVPENLTKPRPAVLCLPGHGRGADAVVGLGEDDYQAAFAVQCVRAGFPTFALEQVSFGHRRDGRARASGPGASSCTRDSMAALMLGETMLGWRVWDALRALDFLQSRPEVNPRRLAVMGISGGGATAFFAACLDLRVRAAVVSGYFNTFQSSILAVDHCVDNYAPGLLRLAEMPDLAALIAPRALFVESGTRDNIFPIAAFRDASRRAREIWTAWEASEKFEAREFDGEHRWHGAGVREFLEKRLG